MVRIKVLFALLLFSSCMWGQDAVSPDDTMKKKEINSLKLSGDAVYADVYQDAVAGDEALAEAQQRSMDLLKTHVVEIFSKRLKMSKEDIREIWAVLESKCKNIVIKRGDLFRVFSYVMKSSFSKDGNQEESKPVEDVKAAETPKVVETPKAVEAPKAVTPAVVAPVPAKTETVVEKDTVAVKTEPVVQPAVVAEQVVKDTVAVAQPAPVVAAAVVEVKETAPAVEEKPAVEVAIPSLCQTMISKGNMNDLMRYLNQEKRYQHLMFGNFNAMQYPEKCYIVLIDKSTRNIVSVLDKGETERMNFITKKLDRYSNYRGGNYAAIFVQEY